MQKNVIMIDGKQIARGRMNFFERAIDIWKSHNPDTDLNSRDIVINIVPKSINFMRLKIGMRICIADGWDGAGRTGRMMGLPIISNQLWYPVLWDDEEDPDFYKASGLMEITNET